MREDMPSSVVMFFAIVVTSGLIMGGVALAIHHILWLAIIVWVLTVPWFLFWAEA